MNELKKYLMDEKGNPHSVLMCKYDGSLLNFGFSFCHKKDKFIKSIGTKIARDRYDEAEIFLTYGTDINDILIFVYRCKKYFKHFVCFRDIGTRKNV